MTPNAIDRSAKQRCCLVAVPLRVPAPGHCEH